MSAFVVSDEHISAIINAFNAIPNVDRVDPQEIGQMLLNENYKGVNCLYGAKTKPGKYQHRSAISVSAIQAIVLIHSLGYQSCDSPKWKKSDAKKFLTEATDKLVTQIYGYETARWTI